ncbi:hypothetical protein Y1Q_0017857 [Alligator mississippiensis]|uniref:PLA2c domain-containing protein n=1 Tax=Alligator mississippiensis TaxID=8496 RepID=A0A151NW95_ALLMI|nr:hypothetical protein Y1Q_0017857 [Alligator mississippiensis]
MIALQGTLGELQNHGLLDSVMYLCGVSGSTWCMSSLYKHWDWSDKLLSLEERMYEMLLSTWSLPKAMKMLEEAAKDENYSLTDFWAYTVVYGMLHECKLLRACKTISVSCPIPRDVTLRRWLPAHVILSICSPPLGSTPCLRK